MGYPLPRMLDLARMDRIQLSAAPRAQRFVACVLLMPNYNLLPGIRIDFEGPLPREPVIYAMNHTDRFNYWPFQYRMWRKHARFTATWVKGKNYEHPLTARFMELTNNIPIVSRGYLITRDFISMVGRRPSDAEYSALRRAVDPGASNGNGAALRGVVPAEVLDRARDLFGYRFDPEREPYPRAMDGVFREMMRRFVDLNQHALDLGLDLLVFPQGTRSIRLSRGHGGLGQIALHLKRPIVPVGCNGNDRLYPGKAPFARRGRVVYRFGEPIAHQDLAAFHPPEPFVPFTSEAEEAHGERFQGVVDLVMERVNDLLDERHRWSDDRESEGTRGTARFV